MAEVFRGDLAYRPDIDGLRAIAVIAVVLFHAAAPGFSGGYVGVDVFFVISGYLITRVLLRDGLERRGFARFYEGRLRRILPALIVMLAGTGVAAYRLLPPVYFVSYLKSVAATCLFASNVLFAREGAGYFALPTQYQPLFHTWSLGVEEQFYLAFPVALWAITRVARRHLPATIAAVTVLSLAGSEYGVRHGWQADFFMTPFRVWELLLGSLLAVGAVPEPRGGAARNGVATIGLALIAFPVTAFTSRTPFPGLHALVPSLGAALMIAANGAAPTWTSSLLSARPLVLIGRISYSLYLWHWPILTLAPLALLHTPSAGERLAAVTLAAVLATLSWQFVEQPFRHRATVPTRWLVVAVGGSLVGFLLVCAVGYRRGGWPGRWQLPARQMLTYLDYANSAERQASWQSGECYITGSSVTVADRCTDPVIGMRNVLLIGDSVAAELAAPLRALLEPRQTHLLQATLAGCLPITSPVPGMSPSCQNITDRGLDLAGRGRVNAVVIATAWARMVEPTLVESGFESTIAALLKTHATVVLLGPPVIYDIPVPLLLALRMERSGAVGAPSSDNFLPGLSAWSARLARRFGQREDLIYVPFFERTCPNDVCEQQLPDGTPIQFDQIHLTAAAASEQAMRVFDAATLRRLAGG